jgi:hypothetical protein
MESVETRENPANGENLATRESPANRANLAKKVRREQLGYKVQGGFEGLRA